MFLTEHETPKKHKCLNGRFVDYFSVKCRVDLLQRIEDAIYFRDNESHRTDARSYFNGILSVLRRKLREVDRELTSQVLMSESFSMMSVFFQSAGEETTSRRILKLSGLF